MQKQLADSDWLSVWFSVRFTKVLLSVGLRRFLLATLLGSFALIGLFFLVRALQQGWQVVQPFEGIAFALSNANRSGLFNPGGGCATLNEEAEGGSGGGPSADLEVTKFVDNPNPREGDTIVYTIFLTNLKPSDVTAVRITDPLPEGVTYTGHIPGGADYNPGNGLWSIDNLPQCGSATLIISATVDSGTAGETITNTASYVGAEPPDTDSDNNVGEAVITVRRSPEADLAITKTANITNPNPGDTITYTVIVTNNGPDDATRVQISDTLPEGIHFITYTAVPSSVYSSTNGLWDVGGLRNTARATLTIGAKVKEGTAGQVIPNTASILAINQADPITGNNISNITITVTSVKLQPIYLPIILKDYEPLICNPYFDNFSDSNSHWRTYRDSHLAPGYSSNGEYYIYRLIPGFDIVSAPVDFANRYTVEVDVHWERLGYEYGIIFAEAESEYPNYSFGVDPNGPTGPRYRIYYNISPAADDWGCAKQADNANKNCWINTPLIYPGSKMNHLKVECAGSKTKVYVNNNPNPLWESSEFSCRGKAGLFVQSLHSAPNAQANFDNFQIRCPFGISTINTLDNVNIPLISISSTRDNLRE